MDHALFFPLPKNEETVSHPVSAWNADRASALAGPRVFAISCTGMYLECIMFIQN